jgi:hypothetical protein
VEAYEKTKLRTLDGGTRTTFLESKEHDAAQVKKSVTVTHNQPQN